MKTSTVLALLSGAAAAQISAQNWSESIWSIDEANSFIRQDDTKCASMSYYYNDKTCYEMCITATFVEPVEVSYFMVYFAYFGDVGTGAGAYTFTDSDALNDGYMVGTETFCYIGEVPNTFIDDKQYNNGYGSVSLWDDTGYPIAGSYIDQA